MMVVGKVLFMREGDIQILVIVLFIVSGVTGCALHGKTQEGLGVGSTQPFFHTLPVPRYPFTVAVLPFEDERDLDNSDHTALVKVPLVFWVTNTYNRPETTQKATVFSEEGKTVHGSSLAEDLAKIAREELARAGLFASIIYHEKGPIPPTVDLILTGQLRSTRAQIHVAGLGLTLVSTFSIVYGGTVVAFPYQTIHYKVDLGVDIFLLDQQMRQAPLWGYLIQKMFSPTKKDELVESNKLLSHEIMSKLATMMKEGMTEATQSLNVRLASAYR